MGYGLLGAHVNMTATGIPELLSEWKPPLIVLLDHSSVWHDVKAASPQTIFVGRIHREPEPDLNDPEFDPLAAASEHCRSILPWAERMGQTYDYWQGINEPFITSVEAMKRLAEFEAERVRLMSREGFRTVVGAFSVGTPELHYWRYFIPALEAARQYQGALALHQYGWPRLDKDAAWFALRHRKVYEGEPEHRWEGLPAHLKSLPLLITECGLDGLLEPGPPPRGWRTLYGRQPQEYLRQLRWYDAQLLQDPYVRGAAIYCCGVADRAWHSYDIWPDIARAVARAATPIYGPRERPAKEPVAPVAPPVLRWRFESEFRPGARVIAGSLPQPGIEITITDPWGNSSSVISGSKPEHGAGGFEFLAPHLATYRLSFLGESFEVQARDGVLVLTFTRVEEAPPGAPGAGPPATPPEVSPPPEETPLDEDAMLDAVLVRLDQIIDTLRERL